MEQRYTTKDLAIRYYKTEKTIRNYIHQIANIYGFDPSQLTRINVKGVQEYRLTKEQAELLGIIMENIEEDVFIREKPTEKVEESKVKDYRDNLLERIESINDEKLKERIKQTPEYQYGVELKQIHEELDEIWDCVLFLLEQFPIEEKVEYERQILEKVKVLAGNLMTRFAKCLEEEAIELLEKETMLETEDGYEWEAPTDDQIIKKVKELLTQQFRQKRLLDHNYAGYNLIEKAISQVLKETVG